MFSGFRSAAFLFCIAALSHAAAPVDERPGGAGEWGFHPVDGTVLAASPPGFCWRPQKGAENYTIQCSRSAEFAEVVYEADSITYNVHCPPQTLAAGTWYWRFRFVDGNGAVSAWSTARSFVIPEGALAAPLPERAELLSRLPQSHPRLWVRPEQLDDLRARARTDLEPIYDRLVIRCEKLIASPPPTEEPPKYPADMKRGSDPWKKMWWGNRDYAIAALNGAATLAFARLLDGNEAYGQLARRLLLECAAWDPKGATGYRYNDEAGMPYAYYFSRAYTFVYDLLSEEERETCRKMMTIRGREMYHHLCPRHLWKPYASHSNRAWHFLGEVGIAFHGEIPEADEWVWFAMNVYANVYPVWSDDDGGWHEGSNYWNQYISRFSWWADVMRVAVGINAYEQKPCFSKMGYYPMYLSPPGTKAGGFGDLTAKYPSRNMTAIMSVLAAQAKNPYWQWYVEAHGDDAVRGYFTPDYIRFVRGSLPKAPATPPVDLPSSRCFRGTGQAYLNSNLLNAADNVEIIFKSSPFGTQSHGYESNNSFLLYAFGERLFIRTGRRDHYGSAHHKNWMWQTKSTNCITVNGEGQKPHSSAAQGSITGFFTSADIDYVSGDATPAYMGKLDRFTRHILFLKPEAVVMFDTLEAPNPSSFEWLLHTPVEMTINGPGDIRVVNGSAQCKTAFLWPRELDISQTDTFDPPPRPRIKLTEYHLTARTKTKAKAVHFVTVFYPCRAEAELPSGNAELVELPNGFGVTVPLSSGRASVLLRTVAGEAVEGFGLSTDADIAAVTFDADGKPKGRFSHGGSRLEMGERPASGGRP